MRQIDELHLEKALLRRAKDRRCFVAIWAQDRSQARDARLMRLMGIETIYRKPNLSRRHPQHKIYPYLLRNMAIERVHQVWSCDITYIPMKQGFLYLVAVIDWHSRLVLSWRLSSFMDKTFCVEALQDALERYGKPEIFQQRPGCSIYLRGIYHNAVSSRYSYQHGRQRPLSRQHLLRAPVARPEIRRGLSQSICHRRRSQNTDRKLVHVLQRPTPSPSLELSNAASVFYRRNACGYVDNARKSSAHIPTSSTASNKEIHMIKTAYGTFPRRLTHYACRRRSTRVPNALP